MGNVSFDYAKGRAAYYAQLPTGGDSLIAVLLNSSGIQTDAAMQVAQFLNTVTGANTEPSAGGYARQTISSPTAAPDTVNHWTIITSATNPVWTALGAGANAIGALLLCFKPNGGTDSTTRPLTKHDFSVTPDGSDVTATIPANGFEKIT